MNNKVIYSLLDAMRIGPESLEAAYVHVLQVLAWAAITGRGEIDSSLSIDAASGANDGKLHEMVYALSQRDEISAYGFKSLSDLQQDQMLGLRAGIQICNRMRSQGLLAGLVNSDMANPSADRSLPPELADLLYGLDACAGKSCYIAWDDSGQLSARMLRTAQKVHCEVQADPAVASLCGIIVGGQFTVAHTNPVYAPGAVDKGKLIRFDNAIGFPPMGVKWDANIAKRDLFARFPEQTGLSSVLSVRHLMAVAEDKVIACVPNGLLFGSNNAEKHLRQSLIERGQLAAVIALPPGLLSATNIAISIIVISPKGGGKSVRFINADDDEYRRMNSKTRSILTNIDAIIDALKNNSTGKSVRDVSSDEISLNDYQLQPSRYLIPDDQQEAMKQLNGKQMITLGSVVEILRPPVIKSKSRAEIPFMEVGVGDLPIAGYIELPERCVEVDEGMAKKLSRLHLRPLDIVLTIKGSVGKIGLVSPEIDKHEIPWIPGQSTVALRVKSPSVDPRALFAFLRSPLGRTLIGGIVSSGTIPFIQTKGLGALGIPLPSMLEQRAAIETLNEEFVLQREILKLQARMAAISQSLWSM